MSEEPQATEAPKSVEYALTKGEGNLIAFTQQHIQAIISGILSTIATDRLNYTVTPFTQFEVAPDLMSIRIREMEPTVQAPEGPAVVAANERTAEADPGNIAQEAPAAEPTTAPTVPSQPE